MSISNDDSHDLGYALRHGFWHRGIASEAASVLADKVRKDGILQYITATHDRNNSFSGAVMRNAGMEYMYSYEEQWQPKDIPVVFRMYQLNADGNDRRVYMKYWYSSSVHFIEDF